MTAYDAAATAFNKADTSGANTAAIAELADIVTAGVALATALGHTTTGSDNAAKAEDLRLYFRGIGETRLDVVFGAARSAATLAPTIAPPSTSALDALVTAVDHFCTFLDAT